MKPYQKTSEYHFSSLADKNKPLDVKNHIRNGREKIEKCSVGHIDDRGEPVRISATETFGCITGMRSSSKNFAPNCVSDDGVNLSTLTPVKVVFIAENLLNPSITFFLVLEED